MTQTAIAQKIDVRQQQIPCYIKGQTFPSLDTLSHLYTTLDLDANETLFVERPKDY